MPKGSREGSNTLLMIDSLYNSLTRTEQKIADMIKRDPDGIVYGTLTDLAEKSGVGDTSVLRLCRKLGFRGYQEFKLKLAQELVHPLQNVNGEIQESDDLVTMAGKITTENILYLQNTLALLDMRELQLAVDAISRAKKLIFIGVGSSAITAADARHRFMRFGLNSELVTDSHVIAMTLALAGPEDLVFAVSTSGSTKDLVDAVRNAKDNGAFFVCLTSQAKSPLTRYADAVLLSSSKESPLQGGAFRSKITQIHVLDILTTIISIQFRERTYPAIEKTSNAVSDKLY
ncbi:MurR/RpiR family transcriptional regulator [Paenibacillus nasutitermitis]|uniref:N-acetylmannosamine kinase n=1 Tax=Paenibacillus nasutitermitis TaxID=1652958 RepID=A0A917E2Q0_9BACL|nr:MurR/RpiR family transcriptional regulator [Paenibacillus nasutitermitis]GGD94333.1 N-acetylmannosamine kinase [Paenibacillus nasutitermitis]